ncbi:MAG: hypothetical protein ACI4UF_11375, partial [Thermoguttaceae bacterium]
MESTPVSVPPQREELENASFLCYADSVYVGTEKRQVFRVGETLEVENYSSLEIKRYGKNVTASVTHSEHLAKNGRFLGSRTQIEMGGAPMVYETGEPKSDGRNLSLDVKVQSQNMTQAQSVKTVLPEDLPRESVSGGYGVETGLLLQPLKLGETRRLVRFNPTMLRWELVDLHAEAAENTKLPSGAEFPLLRVETHSQMLQADGSPDPGQTQNETLWCDGKGLIWKRFSPLMNLASWRVSKAELANFTRTGQYPPAPTGGKPASELEKSFDFAENLNVPLKLTEGKTADFVNDAEGTYT